MFVGFGMASGSVPVEPAKGFVGERLLAPPLTLLEVGEGLKVEGVFESVTVIPDARGAGLAGTLEPGFCGFLFAGGRGSLEDGLVDTYDGGRVVGNGPGLAVKKGAIHEVEGLGGCDGGGAPHEGFLGAGEIKSPHDGGEEAAAGLGIDSTTSFVRRFIKLEGSAADHIDEASADLEGRVAPGLEVFALAVGAGVVMIGGVAFPVFGGAEAGALPGFRGHDVADEVLGGPVVFLKKK